MNEVTPELIWQDGRPMRPHTLRREIAAPTMGSIRSPISGHPAHGLNPRRLAQLLMAAEQGDAVGYFELAEEMEEKDLHYLSVMGTRKRAVSQLDITVEAAGDSADEKADAEFIRAWLKRDMLEDELFHILDAVGKGVSAVEIIWDFTATTWLPADLKWRDPRWFEFDRIGGEELMLSEIGGPQKLPFGKFIVHKHAAKSGLPIRGGLARAAAWGYMFKNFAIKDWVVFLETFGHPLRVGKYGPNESETNKRILMQALTSLGTDAAASFPETMQVEFVDRKAGTAPNDLWRSHAEYFDLQISKAVLGQTNTTDAQAGGLGSGQADVHNEVRGDIERADAKMLAATLNRDLIRPMIIFNRGVRPSYPRLKIGRPDETDAKLDIENAETLAGLGVQIGRDQMRERAGLPAPEEGEEILQPQAPQAPAGEQSGRSGANMPPRRFLGPLKRPETASRIEGAAASSQKQPDDRDGIEIAADEALGDWERLIAPVIAPIEAAIASVVEDGGSLEEVRDLLAGQLSSMDTSAFEQLLERASFGSRMLGDIEARGTEADGLGDDA